MEALTEHCRGVVAQLLTTHAADTALLGMLLGCSHSLVARLEESCRLMSRRAESLAAERDLLRHEYEDTVQALSRTVTAANSDSSSSSSNNNSSSSNSKTR